MLLNACQAFTETRPLVSGASIKITSAASISVSILGKPLLIPSSMTKRFNSPNCLTSVSVFQLMPLPPLPILVSAGRVPCTFCRHSGNRVQLQPSSAWFYPESVSHSPFFPVAHFHGLRQFAGVSCKVGRRQCLSGFPNGQRLIRKSQGNAFIDFQSERDSQTGSTALESG